MPRALIIGGTGAIGTAVARRLLANNWQVDLTGRDPSHVPPELLAVGARFFGLDRDDAAALNAVHGPGADLLLDSGFPVTVLRPSKVHGAWSRQPREWVFVKRALDRRPVVVLAHRGAGRDHPSGAANIALLVELVARNPGRRILNSADPDAPSALEISRTIARHLGHPWREVLVDDAPVGRTPWDAVPPMVLDMSAAAALGYTPAGDYATVVKDEVDWLVAAAHDPALQWAVPAADDRYFGPLLDYAAEDRYLATLASDTSLAPVSPRLNLHCL